MCVCVCVRERERERGGGGRLRSFNLGFFGGVFSVSSNDSHRY